MRVMARMPLLVVSLLYALTAADADESECGKCGDDPDRLPTKIICVPIQDYEGHLAPQWLAEAGRKNAVHLHTLPLLLGMAVTGKVTTLNEARGTG